MDSDVEMAVADEPEEIAATVARDGTTEASYWDRNMKSTMVVFRRITP